MVIEGMWLLHTSYLLRFSAETHDSSVQTDLTEVPLGARLPGWGARGDCSPVARARVRPTGARLGPYEVVMMPPRASGDGAFLQATTLSAKTPAWRLILPHPTSEMTRSTLRVISRLQHTHMVDDQTYLAKPAHVITLPSPGKWMGDTVRPAQSDQVLSIAGEQA